MRFLRSAAIVTIAAAPACLCAQLAPRPADWVMEQEHRDRWMHGRQQQRFTPFIIEHRFLHIDSIATVPSGRLFSITIGRNAFGRDSAVILSDADGRIVRFDAGLAPYRRTGPVYPGDSARMANFRRFRSGGVLTLVGTRAWDLVAPFPRNPSVGMRWTDTIARTATDGPYEQKLIGTRTSRIERDTLVDGRRLWIVRDSAALRYSEQFLEEERTIDTTVTISRRVAGTERGTHLFDPGLGLFRWRKDTTSLKGEATLKYPDGRRFVTPARFDRSRSWTLHDSAGYAGRRAELRAAQSSRFRGMVSTPSTGLQERLARGDPAARDSLIAEWRRAVDPNEAARLWQELGWVRGSRSDRDILDSIRIASGDTAFLYHQLGSRAYSASAPVDTADLRMMLPFMEDPGIAWGLNLSRDWLYENLAQALRIWPPAAVRNEGDRTACTPDACRMLASFYSSARELRLRDVGLVARLATDPATWADTLLHHAQTDRPLLRGAALLARGVGATWTAALKDPVPPPGSGWRQWLEWMNGTDSAYAAMRSAVTARLPQRDTVTQPRFEESHRTALVIYMKRTGRDITGELRRSYETATEDRARLVFGTMLQGLGEALMTPEQIALAFSSADQAKLARAELTRLFRKAPATTDSTEVAALVDRVIASVVELWPLWPPGAADMHPASVSRPELHGSRGRVLLKADNIPDAVREKWSSKVDVVNAGAQWDRREAAVIYSIDAVRIVGPFARLTINATEQRARSADESPEVYASGVTYYLMRRDGQWVIVATEGWVT